MPKWTNEPPPESHGHSMRILRTPSTKPLIAIVTSIDVLGCCTHFAHNRTIPCEGTDACAWCAEGFSWRWHGYLAALQTESFEHFLFEFTATASDTFRNYQSIHNDIRGCVFKALRPSGRPNGRVVIHCKPYDLRTIQLPDPPDVKKILCHIWNVQNNETVALRPGRNTWKDIGLAPHQGDGRNRPA